MIQLEDSPKFKKFNLKCRTCKTCPDISFDLENDTVIIDDDYDNSVKMSLENFSELASQVKAGSFDEVLDFVNKKLIS